VLEGLLVERGARQEFEPFEPPPVRPEGRTDLRELTTFTIDPDTHTWRTFRARPGARIPADGIWYRYAPFLGIPPEALVPVRPPRPDPIVPGAVAIVIRTPDARWTATRTPPVNAAS